MCKYQNPNFTLCVYVVQCGELKDLTNGMMNCSLINDALFSYEDTCNFTCNTGYELSGSVSRTCQSDGNWSGTVTICERGT